MEPGRGRCRQQAVAESERSLHSCCSASGASLSSPAATSDPVTCANPTWNIMTCSESDVGSRDLGNPTWRSGSPAEPSRANLGVTICSLIFYCPARLVDLSSTCLHDNTAHSLQRSLLFFQNPKTRRRPESEQCTEKPSQ